MDPDDTSPLPLGERRQTRRLIRFDPTLSFGAIAQAVTIVGCFVAAYGVYQADRATTKLEIEQVKSNAIADKLETREAIRELRQDVRTVQQTVSSVDKTVTGIKAGIDAGKGGKQ